MIQRVNYIFIKADLDTVFSIAADVEKYPEFIPEFKTNRVQKIEDNKIVVERAIKIGVKTFPWKSVGIIKRNHSIIFDQIEGFLKGMHTEWIFEKVKNGTGVRVTHEFEIKIPLIGNMIGKYLIWNLFIKKIADKILIRLKDEIENRRQQTQ